VFGDSHQPHTIDYSLCLIVYSLFFHSVHPVTNMTSDTSSSACIPYIT